MNHVFQSLYSMIISNTNNWWKLATCNFFLIFNYITFHKFIKILSVACFIIYYLKL